MSNKKERFLFSFSSLALIPGQENDFVKIICNPDFITRSLPTIFQALVKRLLVDEIDLVYAFHKDLNYWQQFFYSLNIKISSDLLGRIKLSPIEDSHYFVGDHFYAIQIKKINHEEFECSSVLWICCSNSC